MRVLFPLFFLAAVGLGALSPPSEPGDLWSSALGKGDGTFAAETFRIVRTPTESGAVVETLSPAHGTLSSKVRVELDGEGNLIRSRTDYFEAQLAAWFRADFLLTEVQPEDHNLAFQRVQHNEVQDARNFAWGPGFVEFSTLPFLLERRVARGEWGPFRFQTYFDRSPGTMEVTFTKTDRPLDAEKRYRYPRFLRERFGTRTVVLAALHGVGDFQAAYPYPFFYAYEPSTGSWIASWGGNPQSTSFQWKAD